MPLRWNYERAGVPHCAVQRLLPPLKRVPFHLPADLRLLGASDPHERRANPDRLRYVLQAARFLLTSNINTAERLWRLMWPSDSGSLPKAPNSIGVAWTTNGWCST